MVCSGNPPCCQLSAIFRFWGMLSNPQPSGLQGCASSPRVREVPSLLAMPSSLNWVKSSSSLSQNSGRISNIGNMLAFQTTKQASKPESNQSVGQPTRQSVNQLVDESPNQSLMAPPSQVSNRSQCGCSQGERIAAHHLSNKKGCRVVLRMRCSLSVCQAAVLFAAATLAAWEARSWPRREWRKLWKLTAKAVKVIES